REQGWTLPDLTHVQPYMITEPRRGNPDVAALRPVREVVFFARQDVRKGLLLFVAAIERLAQSPVAVRGQNLVVTILGEPAVINGRDSEEILRERAERWPFPLQILSGLRGAEAREYLRVEGRLAVMPSLVANCPGTVRECLAGQVPFLASRVGGIPEL